MTGEAPHPEQGTPGDDGPLTDFGYSQVPRAEKHLRVRQVFDSVAPRYDVMNDLMSLGLHRIWKRIAAGMLLLRAGETALDLAAGTGDMTRLLARRVGPRGLVVSSDINAAMLSQGRDRLLDRGIAANTRYLQANAEQLPLAEASLHAVTIAFGLRNVTDKAAALGEMYRVLRPGGQLLVLEFSRPAAALQPLYDRYSFTVLPRIGQLVARDAASYRYLAESIRRHPDQQTLLSMLETAGFARCRYQNLSAGIVAIHTGFRLG